MSKVEANVKNREFYKDKRILVTGHTGFKGAWLTTVLHELGSNMIGYALEPQKGSMFEKINGKEMVENIESDVRDLQKLKDTVLSTKPEIVIHLAAQAIVKECYDNPHYTFETNVMGTVNLLEAIRECQSVKSVVVVTTDKVYENKGDGAVYIETDPLGGIDPYSSSKTCMEYITECYKKSYFQSRANLGIATIRASNVLGGGDHVQSRLIPSILNAISKGKPIELRNPHQTRPWQSIMDALNGYLSVGRLLYTEPEKYSRPWNIGPTIDGIKDVMWVVDRMREHYSGTKYVIGKTYDVKESKTLGLDITTSLRELDWRPLQTCDQTLYNIVEYYKKQKMGISEREIAKEQVDNFFEIR